MLNALLWNLLLTTALALALALACQTPWLCRRPALRHWLWLLLLFKLVTPPLIAVPLLPAATGNLAVAAYSTPASYQVEYDAPAIARPDRFDASRNVDGATPRPSRVNTRPLFVGGLFAVSLIGSCVLLTFQGYHALRLFRWLRRAGTESPLLAETCARVASRLAIHRAVRTCVVNTRTPPLLCAWRQPLLVVPRELIDNLTPQQLRSIVAHELGHLMRHDHWANAFVFVVKTLLWWNPVIWWADRELRAAQELCCDAIAIDCCSAGRRDYAQTLLQTLDFIQAGPVVPRVLAAGMGSSSVILRRFEMIGEKHLSYRLSPGAFLVLAVIGLPLVCMPVHGEERSGVPASSTTSTAPDKDERLRYDFQAIGRSISEYQRTASHFPKNLAEMNKPLPKDVYSPTGDNYHYEPQRTRFILSSCGQDGIYGNDDDEILITYRSGATSGQRHELYPLKPEERLVTVSEKETVVGVRPQGNCSISGKVVAKATGEPIAKARMYLHYNVTHGSIFVNTASDGTFQFENIPQGPFSLCMSGTSGYQDAVYNPEDKLGPYPPFSLTEGEHRAGIVLKAKQSHRIAGKILDETGKKPDDIGMYTVLAWFKSDDGDRYQDEQGQINSTTGTYLIDGLGDKPVYVMAINWHAARAGTAYPPIYYPSTFSRDDAKLITFDKAPSVDNIDITLRKEGGLVVEGTVRDEAGKPIPEAFVVMHRRDMLFDFVTAYTDQQGRYQIQGLGAGEFLMHVDAVHRGFVRMRTPVQLDDSHKTSHRDFSLARGVTILGKFVDENGDDWRIGVSFGNAAIPPAQHNPFSLTDFRNKHRPHDAAANVSGFFSKGEGGYETAEMIFPTENTFLIQGMMPGHTMIDFSPYKEGQEVKKILHGGQDILKSGLDTKSGQEINDITIVIARK